MRQYDPEAWYVETWYVSGVHTGYRVMRGFGLAMEIAEGFTGDTYKPGSFERALKSANSLRDKLNIA